MAAIISMMQIFVYKQDKTMPAHNDFTPLVVYFDQGGSVSIHTYIYLGTLHPHWILKDVLAWADNSLFITNVIIRKDNVPKWL